MSCSVQGDEAVFVWTERGGPPVKPPVGASGFGGRLLDRLVERQLRGAVEYKWPAEGLIAVLRIKPDRLAS